MPNYLPPPRLALLPVVVVAFFASEIFGGGFVLVDDARVGLEDLVRWKVVEFVD